MQDTAITVFVIGGPSTGLKHELAKQRTSIGQIGGGADIEINEHQASVLHCVLQAHGDMVRLYDLDSTNGTFVEDERIQASNLDHYSEFRVGSTVFLVTIVPRYA